MFRKLFYIFIISTLLLPLSDIEHYFCNPIIYGATLVSCHNHSYCSHSCGESEEKHNQHSRQYNCCDSEEPHDHPDKNPITNHSSSFFKILIPQTNAITSLLPDLKLEKEILCQRSNQDSDSILHLKTIILTI